MHKLTQLWSENLKGRCRLEDLDVDWRIVLKLIVPKYSVKVSTGCTFLRTGINDVLLCIRQ
jgi:hypothetical protein